MKLNIAPFALGRHLEIKAPLFGGAGGLVPTSDLASMLSAGFAKAWVPAALLDFQVDR